MLSIEIRVNGQPIGTIEGYRGDRVGEGSGPEITYHYPYRAVFFPLQVREAPDIYEGAVSHRYYDGMEKLAALILADIAAKKEGT